MRRLTWWPIYSRCRATAGPTEDPAFEDRLFILLYESIGRSDLSANPMVHACHDDASGHARPWGRPTHQIRGVPAQVRDMGGRDVSVAGHEPEQFYTVNKVLNEPDFFPLAIMHELFGTFFVAFDHSRYERFTDRAS